MKNCQFLIRDCFQIEYDKFIIYLTKIMRKRISPEKKNKPFGISFPPELKDAARKRAYMQEMSLSKYLQQLVERDLKSRNQGGVSR